MHTFQMSPNHSSCCASFKFHLNKTSLENAPGAGCFQREAHERRENVEERVRAARAKKHVPTSLSICTRAPVVMQDDVEGVQLPHQARRPVDQSCHESRLLVVDQFQKVATAQQFGECLGVAMCCSITCGGPCLHALFYYSTSHNILVWCCFFKSKLPDHMTTHPPVPHTWFLTKWVTGTVTMLQ